MKALHIYSIGVLVAALDQTVKSAVVERIPYGSSTPIAGDILHFTTRHNAGGAFGLFGSSGGLLALVTVAVITAIVILSHKHPHMPEMAGIALALLLGGAIGNLIDRVRLGYVVDFIDVRFWPVFNIADSAITLGLILLAFYIIVIEGRRPPAPETTDAAKD